MQRKLRIYLALTMIGAVLMFILAVVSLLANGIQKDDITISWLVIAVPFAVGVAASWREYSKEPSSRTLGWLLVSCGLLFNLVLTIILPAQLLYAAGFALAGVGLGLVASSYSAQLKALRSQTTELEDSTAGSTPLQK